MNNSSINAEYRSIVVSLETTLRCQQQLCEMNTQSSLRADIYKLISRTDSLDRPESRCELTRMKIFSRLRLFVHLFAVTEWAHPAHFSHRLEDSELSEPGMHTAYIYPVVTGCAPQVGLGKWQLIQGNVFKFSRGYAHECAGIWNVSCLFYCLPCWSYK